MEKENKKRRGSFRLPSAYSVLLLIILALAIVTLCIPSVTNATLQMVVMSPFKGFVEAIDVAIFVLIIGGFLGVLSKTGALQAGIGAVVKRFKGKEMIMIPILMFLFSIGGTTYGMAEETIAFYVLIVGAMMIAGFDSLTGAAVILLGAGVGVLGSTVNPFAISVAVDSFTKSFPDVAINQTVILVLGTILWLTSYIIATYFVMKYAKKVKNNKDKTLLSQKEVQNSEKLFLHKNGEVTPTLTTKRKVILLIFALCFVVMITSLIPWNDFGITFFDGWTGWLTGVPFGQWYFQDLAAWFTIGAVIIGLIDRMSEKDIVDSFIEGASDMIGVVLVIAVSRGISVLMAETGLGIYILETAAHALQGVPTIIFSGLSYLVYVGLSFLIPSTSGLATASIPTMGGLAHMLQLSPEVMIMIFCAACGLVNLVTPTSAVVMGGLATSKIEFSTWIKFVGKVFLVLLVVNILILTIAMLIL